VEIGVDRPQVFVRQRVQILPRHRRHDRTRNGVLTGSDGDVNGYRGAPSPGLRLPSPAAAGEGMPNACGAIAQGAKRRMRGSSRCHSPPQRVAAVEFVDRPVISTLVVHSWLLRGRSLTQLLR
jgi:hypothetical protein